MKKLAFTLSLATLAFASNAQAKPALTEAQARAAIAPLYATFSQPVQGGTVRELLTKGTTAEWQSCESMSVCRGLEKSVEVFSGFGKMMPNMKHTIKQVLVSGNNVTVLGEISATPSGEFFGVPYTGRSFTIMTMDTHVVKNGKLAHTYHIEDWASALRQLSAK